MHAGQAVFTVAAELQAVRAQAEILVRTDLFAGHALDAAVRLQLQQALCRHGEVLVLNPLEHLLVEGAHLGRSDEVLVCTDLLEDGGQTLVRVLVDSYLLVHIEDRQIVVHHQDGPNVIVLDTMLLAEFVPVLCHIDAGVAVGNDREDIGSIERPLGHEFPYDLGNGPGIIRTDEGDFIGLVGQVIILEFLRDA